MSHPLTLLMIVLPLGLDTFAVAAAVGANRISGWSRWRIAAIFTLFEGGTPVIGLCLGASAGRAFGGIAEYLSAGLLILLGSYLWWSDDDHDEGDEATRARRLVNTRGLALIGLALSISLDELAIGFSFGLGANLATPIIMIAVIAVQAFAVAQLGLSLGTRISDALRERMERLVGPILIVIGLSPITEALISSEWVPPRGAAIVSALVVILVGAVVYRRLAAERIRLWPRDRAAEEGSDSGRQALDVAIACSKAIDRQLGRLGITGTAQPRLAPTETDRLPAPGVHDRHGVVGEPGHQRDQRLVQ